MSLQVVARIYLHSFRKEDAVWLVPSREPQKHKRGDRTAPSGVIVEVLIIGRFATRLTKGVQPQHKVSRLLCQLLRGFRGLYQRFGSRRLSGLASAMVARTSEVRGENRIRRPSRKRSATLPRFPGRSLRHSKVSPSDVRHLESRTQADQG